MRVVVLHTYTKIEVCRPCHSEDMAHDVCQAMGLVTLTFDLLTLTLVCELYPKCKVGNLPSKFGHARPLGSRIIRYVCDGRTDRQTDGRTDKHKSNAYCHLPYGREHKKNNKISDF